MRLLVVALILLGCVAVWALVLRLLIRTVLR